MSLIDEASGILGNGVAAGVEVASAVMCDRRFKDSELTEALSLKSSPPVLALTFKGWCARQQKGRDQVTPRSVIQEEELGKAIGTGTIVPSVSDQNGARHCRHSRMMAFRRAGFFCLGVLLLYLAAGLAAGTSTTGGGSGGSPPQVRGRASNPSPRLPRTSASQLSAQNNVTATSRGSAGKAGTGNSSATSSSQAAQGRGNYRTRSQSSR
uniref:Uncharacterized protein n=1 Tax=Anopheles albimanus TaxID=7167 RepID=A0A182F1N2_ANOAL